MKLPKDVVVPNDTRLAIYLPAGELETRFYVSSLGLWVEPGRALRNARDSESQRFFSQTAAVDFTQDDGYGLLVDLDPKWSVQGGTLRLEMAYKVFAADAKEVLTGTETQSVGINAGGPGGGFHAASGKAMQQILVHLLTELKPSAEKFPANAKMSAINRDLIVNRDDPVSTGTAFFINSGGQLLTAAHVLDNCLVIEGKKDDKKFPVLLRAESRLLDLAVVDSGQATDKALPFRQGEEVMLGEAVTNVGYPLQGLLAASPNLTRGNVSASGGLKGSMGIFQFSAPIQPGASGGPVVSDAGELLGVTVGTLNAARLIKDGVLPQNVNFALDARYAAMFLRKSNIEFTEVAPAEAGGMRTANDAALGAVVQLSCYQ
ncbi:MAG: serine protease [Steroidobacteraceae bacterium]